MSITEQETQFQEDVVETESENSVSDLPLIPLPKELEDLPPLPKDTEEKMRILARHAIEIILERYKDGTLKLLHKRHKVKGK